MPEYGNIDQALAGLQVGMMARVDSAIAQEDIDFGEPVMGYSEDDGNCYAIHRDCAVVTITAALVAQDTLAITINGIVKSATYASSSDATMLALKNAINADADIAALGVGGVIASLTGTSTYRTITLKTKGVDLTVTTEDTKGGQGTFASSVAYSCWAKFLGIALFAQRGGRDYGAAGSIGADGTSGYKQYDAVNIMNFGRVWVKVVHADSIKAYDAAYAIYVPTNQGKCTNSSSSTFNLNSVFITSENTQYLAILEVRSVQ